MSKFKKTIARRDFLKRTVQLGAALGSLGGLADRVVAATGRTAVSMPHRELGTTGANIPIIQLGTSQWLNTTYDRIMHRCYREGVRALDTALSYGWGTSHRAIATFLGQVRDRKGIWLTSKSGDEDPEDFSRDLDRVLEELRTDYLDLYLMHSVNSLDMLEPGYLKNGEKLRKSGKTRFFGFSCHGSRVVPLMNRAAKVGGIDAILFRYNFRRYGDLELNRAIDACRKAGIGLMAMKTNGGVSTEAEKVVNFRSRNFTLGQAKLKAVWEDDRIDTIVSEMDSLRIVKENVAAAKSEQSLAAGEWEQLHRLADMTAHLACNGCAHLCEGAIGGAIPIADPLRFLMYDECHGDRARARRLYRAIPDALRDTRNVDLAAASRACPQGIDIAARLEAARKALAA